MRLLAKCAVATAALSLSACGGMELDRTSHMTPTGSAFDQALFSEYLSLSRGEYAEGDYSDSDAFALRARSAGQGNAVEPEALAARNIPAGKQPELSTARGRLVAALDAGARGRSPQDAAQAQAMFDCWMQEQEENFQPDDIAACRAAFFAALAKIEVAPQPMAQPAPAPAPAPQPETVSIYFDHDSAALTPAARSEVSRAVARIRAIGARTVALEGHTDRSGSARYNMRLSERRVEAVRDAIENSGVNVRFRDSAVGENRPAVPTADGVRERRNREVVVHIMP